MKKRHIVELLQLLDKEVDGPHFATGLCGLTSNLSRYGILTHREQDRLNIYLIGHRFKGKSLNNFWWTEGEKKPRHKWLRKRIRIEKIRRFLGLSERYYSE